MFENITSRHFADPGDLRDAPEPEDAAAMAALAASEAAATTGYAAHISAYERLTYAANKAALEYGDDISPTSIFGLEIDGPNGTVTIGRSASDAATITVSTYGLNADGDTDDPRPSWTATFSRTTPAAIIAHAGKAAVDAIN